ncbi:flavin oxidoreductase/NADH oxidase [Acetatifactor muris]|uniref:NADPH dehydrogenase n=1 Tax=Acetatifactor muris TaxID=879566 RepID=A0A2K4ZNV1_9FIRM|nr:flavin oxidoreductase/NADH oxidase [Acetatifactor muris]MCR2050436.1 flavin oxidoreductase/NADH oxidase [Acetatifactor muris]SOY32062.1 NADPH dehydrogenase [Acetatifactor muris]
MKHERFTYKSLEEIRAKAEELQIHLPFGADTHVLREKVSFGNVTLENRMGIAPMEGADGLPDGSPSELTLRRYVREAEGASGMIWFEAISIVPEGRSGAHQLMLTRDNLENYKKLTSAVKEAGIRANGFAPYLVMQANHSGRYSNPQGRPAPLIAYRHPEYEKLRPADDSCIVCDDYLKGLEEKFGEAALLAKEAGFDAVDVKACHGYLLMELLSAYHRPGLYGGSFENRTRLLRNGISAAKVHEDSDFLVTARIGIYDGFAWPYGFGVKEGAGAAPDMEEPIRLIRLLHEAYGLPMVNLTMGNPYVSTHVTRPFDGGKYIPEEHPLYGVARIIRGIGEVKKAVPGMFISASGPSYLRQYSDLYAAGAVEEGLCDNMLFGRMSFANPAFPRQILESGRIDARMTCVACGKCGDLIRAGKPTGCIVRDAGTYLEYYREYQKEIQ